MILLAKLWVLMYALTILCISLGVIVVVMPNKRKPMKDED